MAEEEVLAGGKMTVERSELVGTRGVREARGDARLEKLKILKEGKKTHWKVGLSFKLPSDWKESRSRFRW